MLAKLLAQSQFPVFMTGAGVSTASGIPDYRSKKGLYQQQETPEYLLSKQHLEDNPETFYQYVKANLYYPDAKPNIIHQKIAMITQQKGALITQNVDNLDSQAGTTNKVEFHGNLYQTYCQKCQKKVPYQSYLKNYHHENCGGIIRAAVTLYGEMIAPRRLETAINLVQKADLLIIVGTSMQVYPFAGLLQYRQEQAKIVAINQEKLMFDAKFEMIQADAVKIFESI